MVYDKINEIESIIRINGIPTLDIDENELRNCIKPFIGYDTFISESFRNKRHHHIEFILENRDNASWIDNIHYNDFDIRPYWFTFSDRHSDNPRRVDYFSASTWSDIRMRFIDKYVWHSAHLVDRIHMEHIERFIWPIWTKPFNEGEVPSVDLYGPTNTNYDLDYQWFRSKNE